MIVYVILVYMY